MDNGFVRAGLHFRIIAPVIGITLGSLGLAGTVASPAGADGSASTPKSCVTVGSVSEDPSTPSTFTLPQFDGTGGTLTAVDVTLTGTLMFGFYGQTTANPAGAPYYATDTSNGLEAVSGPGLSPLPTDITSAPAAAAAVPAGSGALGLVQQYTQASGPLTPVPGGPVPHYAAPDGFSVTQSYPVNVSQSVDPSDLSSWTGTGSNTLDALGVSLASTLITGGGGNGTLGSTFDASATACVVYEYLPAVTPETPSTIALPLIALGLIGGGTAYSVRRRRIPSA